MRNEPVYFIIHIPGLIVHDLCVCIVPGL